MSDKDFDPSGVTSAVPPDAVVFGEPPEFSEVLPAFERLCRVVARLRAPDGCPWDRVQTLASIKPHTLEETYELLEAIDSGDDAAIVEELGDVLLQVILDSQIGNDERRFRLVDVVSGIESKLVRRHPHVFGDDLAETATDVLRHWERAKQQEKQRDSILDGLPIELPALARAARLSDKAAKVGYDFPDRLMLFDKLREELAELSLELFGTPQPPAVAAGIEGEPTPDQPIADPSRKARAESELGDVLFVIANIARRFKLNPEEALRSSNRKFERRFRAIETGLRKAGMSIHTASLAEMEAEYQRAKAAEADGGAP